MTYVKEPIHSHIPNLVSERIEVWCLRSEDCNKLHRILDIELPWGESLDQRKSSVEFHIEHTSSESSPFGYRAIVSRD